MKAEMTMAKIQKIESEIKITVIGTGYVGLVSGTCLSELGYTVYCIDKDEEKIRKLQSGYIPIYEPGLEELVRRNVENGRLNFSTDLASAVSDTTVIFITVGTPNAPDTGRPNLSYMQSAIKELALLMTEYKTIVIKSTVPIGTAREMKALMANLNLQANFGIVSNPEFLREGHAVYDFMNPDRIILGFEDDVLKSNLDINNLNDPKSHSKTIMEQIYAPFSTKNVPILNTNLESAEVIKYTANSFLAVKIAFINEVANLCEKVDGNIETIATALGLDPRIGPAYLKVGPGFGGSCFPKDIQALVALGNDYQVPQTIVEAAMHSNETRKLQMIDKIISACRGTVDKKKIAVLGLSFKANTDDIRDSPAIPIIKGLQAAGADIVAYDPVSMSVAKLFLAHIEWAKDIEMALKGVYAVVIATEWPEFSRLDFDLLAAKPVIIDLRNLYEPDKMLKKGINYHCIGKKS